MSKPPPSASHKSKPTSAGGKKDAKSTKQAEDEQLMAAAPPPPPPPIAPFDVLSDVWSLSSLVAQRERISALLRPIGLPSRLSLLRSCGSG